MRKIKILLLSLFALSILTGFENQDKLVIHEAEITIIESEGILRYDFIIENTGDTPIKSNFDYPGNHPFGIEFVVRPSDELADQMVMEENTSFNKMLSMGRGQLEFFEAGAKMPVHLEYKMKKDANPKQVEKLALDSDLLILDGVDIAVQFDLRENLK